ncbi:MAG: hypothetical protein ACXWKB_01615 [Methyloceanibacter sp.]
MATRGDLRPRWDVGGYRRDLAAALNQELVELGLSPHPLDAVRSMVGGGLSKLLGRALAAHAAGLDAVQQDAAAARLLEFYAEKPAGQSSLYPGRRG